MQFTVHELREQDFQRWDRFVAEQPDSTFFHKSGWKTVLERSFRHRTHFLYAEYENEIAGILPLALVNSKLFGTSLSSLPFCVYGGPVTTSDTVREVLINAACDLANQRGVGSLEIRNQAQSGLGWPVKDLYATFKKAIETDHDLNMKAIPNKQRAMVRKGIKAGLKSEQDTDSERLYRVYSESVRNLGTPVFSKRYFDILMEVFGDDCRILMIKSGGDDIAGVMSFYFKDEVLPYYGGSVAAARQIKGANDFMYWEVMRRSCDEGIKLFDFGRSKKGTGPFSFKKNWGFKPQPLSYEYYLVKDSAIPEVNPLNPKYKLMVDTWKKLPLPVANFVGPFLARSLG